MSRGKSQRLKTSAQLASGRASKTALGYRAVEDSVRRRATVRHTSAELAILTPSKRQAASATTREDRRNMTLLAWMIRRQITNVSRFTPHIRIAAAPEVTAIVKRLLAMHARPKNFDTLGRLSRDEWLWMFEACKVIEGDCGGLHAAGLKLQGIEGDRICKPGAGSDKGMPKDVSEEGLVFDKAGAIRQFCVCKRGGVNGSTLEFEAMVDREVMSFDGYWPERFDSNRGVSPLMTCLNEAADVRDVWEWLVQKAKNSGIFGLAFTRTGSSDVFPTQSDPATTPPTNEANAYSAQVTAAIKNRGMINLDLDPGDTVEEIESKSPNPNVIPMTRELVREILLALDIPFTFYDSLSASFSARIADRNEYEESCEPKRAKNMEVLDEIYGDWILPKWAEADLFGLSSAMKAAKISIEEIAASLRWVPAGRPWLDRANEMSGHILALAAGVTSIPRICASYGEDGYEIAAEQKEFLEKCGIPLLYAQGGQFSVQSLMGQTKPADETPAAPAEEPEEPAAPAEEPEAEPEQEMHHVRRWQKTA